MAVLDNFSNIRSYMSNVDVVFFVGGGSYGKNDDISTNEKVDCD